MEAELPNSLGELVPVANSEKRVSIGVAFLRQSMGRMYVLLVKPPYTYAIRGLCYTLGVTKPDLLNPEMVQKYIDGLQQKELDALKDTLSFSAMVESIYQSKLYIVPKVMAGYRASAHWLRLLKPTGGPTNVLWSFPKGGADAEKETRLITIEREIMEETGLKRGRYTILGIPPVTYEEMDGKYVFRVHIYFGELEQTVIFPTKDVPLTPTLRDMVTISKHSHEIESVEFVPLDELSRCLSTTVYKAFMDVLPMYVAHREKLAYDEIASLSIR